MICSNKYSAFLNNNMQAEWKYFRKLTVNLSFLKRFRYLSVTVPSPFRRATVTVPSGYRHRSVGLPSTFRPYKNPTVPYRFLPSFTVTFTVTVSQRYRFSPLPLQWLIMSYRALYIHLFKTRLGFGNGFGIGNGDGEKRSWTVKVTVKDGKER